MVVAIQGRDDHSSVLGWGDATRVRRVNGQGLGGRRYGKMRARQEAGREWGKGGGGVHIGEGLSLGSQLGAHRGEVLGGHSSDDYSSCPQAL